MSNMQIFFVAANPKQSFFQMDAAAFIKENFYSTLEYCPLSTAPFLLPHQRALLTESTLKVQ